MYEENRTRLSVCAIVQPLDLLCSDKLNICSWKLSENWRRRVITVWKLVLCVKIFNVGLKFELKKIKRVHYTEKYQNDWNCVRHTTTLNRCHLSTNSGGRVRAAAEAAEATPVEKREWKKVYRVYNTRRKYVHGSHKILTHCQWWPYRTVSLSMMYIVWWIRISVLHANLKKGSPRCDKYANANKEEEEEVLKKIKWHVLSFLNNSTARE